MWPPWSKPCRRERSAARKLCHRRSPSRQSVRRPRLVVIVVMFFLLPCHFSCCAHVISCDIMRLFFNQGYHWVISIKIKPPSHTTFFGLTMVNHNHQLTIDGVSGLRSWTPQWRNPKTWALRPSTLATSSWRSLRWKSGRDGITWDPPFLGWK